jgi:hypothetical protein
MNATAIEIADAVVAALNGATLGQPVSAERYYLPEFDLKDMDTPHVSVVPAELDAIGRNFAGHLSQHKMAIGLALIERLVWTGIGCGSPLKLYL